MRIANSVRFHLEHVCAPLQHVVAQQLEEEGCVFVLIPLRVVMVSVQTSAFRYRVETYRQLFHPCDSFVERRPSKPHSLLDFPFTLVKEHLRHQDTQPRERNSYHAHVQRSSVPTRDGSDAWRANQHQQAGACVWSLS